MPASEMSDEDYDTQIAGILVSGAVVLLQARMDLGTTFSQYRGQFFCVGKET